MSLTRYHLIEEDLTSLFEKVSIEQLEDLKNSSIYVSGGGGFLGTWLAEVVNFLNKNFSFSLQLTLMDRDFSNIQNHARHLLNSESIQLVKGDVRSVFELPRETRYVLHAAGSPSSREHVSKPIDVMTSIAVGTEKLLSAAERLSDIRMFMNMSSGLVSGYRDANCKIKESDGGSLVPPSESNIYVEAKRYGEALASAFRQHNRMGVITMRPFTFIGPYQPLRGPWALNNFISDAIKGRPITILGDGQSVRSYLYGADAAYWILAAFCKGRSGDVFNLGSSVPVTMAELATMIQEEFGRTTSINYCANQAKVSSNWLVPCTEHVTEKLGVKEVTPISESLKRTISWYRHI